MVRPNNSSFQGLCGKKITLTNDGEQTSTDGGLILNSLIEKQFGITENWRPVFKDLRRQRAVKPQTFRLLFQRIAGLIQGYEDLNDHEEWRNVSLLNTILGREPRPLFGWEKHSQSPGTRA
jgi:hypothetical protein